MRESVGFAVWTSSVPTGGNRYDAELAAGLRALGVDVDVRRVPGEWPGAGAADRQALGELLAEHRVWLVDAIVAAAAPEVVRTAQARDRRLVALVHHFLPDDPTLDPVARRRLRDSEQEALSSVSAVVATSAWTAAQLRDRYGLQQVTVAVPGVRPAPLSVGSTGPSPRLLTLGSLTPTKDQLTLVAALELLGDLGWSAHVVGPDTVDPHYTGRLRRRVATAGLAGQVYLTGTRTGDGLEAEWAASDLLVLPSSVEPYGMVVTEALARGLPSVVTEGTGAVEAQSAGLGRDPGSTARPGAGFPVGDVGALADVLRDWITDPGLRRRWRAAAVRARPHLPTWSETADAVLPLLRTVGARLG